MYIYYIGKNLTENFTREEYAVNWKEGDGRVKMYENTMLFARIMQAFRDEIGKPIIVTSWFRTKKMNSRLKNAISNSNHLKGCAMDFYIKGVSCTEKNFIHYVKIFKSILADLDTFGLMDGLNGEAGLYNGWFHFGIQNYSRTFYHWDTRTGKQINNPFRELLDK